jgi:hypothetical protein
VTNIGGLCKYFSPSLLHRHPCEKMLEYLQTYFQPDEFEPGYSLSISAGRSGHRLSHDHSTQYTYVKQTLMLWREILHEMFMLWSLADQDLLNSHNVYKLMDTGQGVQRMQPCPAIGREMHRTLYKAQKKAKAWIGSSVIHLGDKNVPNALMFIDKVSKVAMGQHAFSTLSVGFVEACSRCWSLKLLLTHTHAHAIFFVQLCQKSTIKLPRS